MKEFKELSGMNPEYSKEVGGIPPFEADKFRYTVAASDAVNKRQYDVAIEILQKLAKLCHYHGRENDANDAEHRVFLCEQLKIYEKAGVVLDYFDQIPYLEILKVTLTRLAAEGANQGEDSYARCTFCNSLNARICRAQDKKQDAMQLEHTILNSNKASGYGWVGNRRMTAAEFEVLEMENLAKEYRYDYEIYK